MNAAVRLLDLVGGDRRVGHADLRAAAREREVRRRLRREGEHRVGVLARLRALLRLACRVGLLGRPALDRHRQAADAARGWSPWGRPTDFSKNDVPASK